MKATVLAVGLTLAIALSWGIVATAVLAGSPAHGGSQVSNDGCCGSCPAHQDNSKDAKVKKEFDSPPAIGTKAICPVTNSEFEVSKDTLRSEYKGKHYVFCCPACKPTFDKDPSKFTGK